MYYKILGFINIGLLVVITAPYWLRKLNQWFFHSKNPKFLKVLQVLRVAHKPLAALFLVSVVVHGYLALGGFRWHTGTVAALSFLVTILFGLCYYFFRKRPLLMIHKGMVLVSLALVVVHVFWPWLLSSF